MSSRSLAACLIVLAVGGCVSFVLDRAPPGFVEQDRRRDAWGAVDLSMQGPRDVQLRIRTGHNLLDDTLASHAQSVFWRVPRGYVLTAQAPVISGNGVTGTRFDFSYAPTCPTTRPEDFRSTQTQVFFVTDRWEVTVELLGEPEAVAEQDIDGLLADLQLHGCKRRKHTCKSPQPEQFPINAPLGVDRDGCEAEPEPEPEPTDGDVCAHMADILRLDDPHAYVPACAVSLASLEADLDPEAAAKLTACVLRADSVADIVECRAPMRRNMCTRIADLVAAERPADQPALDEDERRALLDQCYDDLEAARLELGPLAIEWMIACVLDASSVDELERCKY